MITTEPITVLEFDAWSGSGDMSFHVITEGDLKEANPDIDLEDEDQVWDTLREMMDDNGTIWVVVNLLSGVTTTAIEQMRTYRKYLIERDD